MLLTVYTTGHAIASSLAICVASLHSSNNRLSSSIQSLHNGVHDLPRTSLVISNTRVSPSSSSSSSSSSSLPATYSTDNYR